MIIRKAIYEFATELFHEDSTDQAAKVHQDRFFKQPENKGGGRGLE